MYGFDRWLDIDLRQAFKDCGLDYDTYCGYAVPKEVCMQMQHIADERNEQMLKAGLIPGSSF